MIKNFFVVAWGNLIRNKGFSIINISGLIIGMASALVIFLWVQNELKFDNFYANKDRLYQAWNRDKGNDGIGCWNVTPKILGLTLKKDYPEVEKATRVFWDEYFLFTVGEKSMSINGNMVDPDFLTMFNFPFVKGDMNTALDNPTDIVITQKLARKLFGNEDAMGKSIKVDNKYNFTVSGIIKDLPGNTQFAFEYLLPWSHVKTTNQDDSSWGSNSTRNYVLLKPNANIASFNAKIKDIYKRHVEHSGTSTVESFLYPVSKLHLYSNFENGIPAGGKIESVRIFALIGLFILLIACINFMNMSTARSEKRAKEVGIRKVVGARKGSLIAQFIGESILIAFIAGIIALVVVQLFLPAFNGLISKLNNATAKIVIDYANVYFIVAFIGFILFTGIIAGSYPAFFLSSFRPVSVLKGSFKKANALITPRKVLVVLQFSFSIILIIFTIIIQKQTKYTEERQSGYERNNLLYVPLGGDIPKNYDILKNELLNSGIASSITKTSAPITEGWSSGGADWDGKNPNDKTEFNYYTTDGNFIQTAGLQLVSGRDIDIKKYSTDSDAVVINESAAKLMGFKNASGQLINRGNPTISWHVVGIAKDFIIQSPYDLVKPMVIQGPKGNWFNEMHIRLNNTRSTAQNIASMEKIFKHYNPGYPFDYYFVDEKYAVKFDGEKTTGTLTAFFAGLTIFISCLGLFGLATYMAENRIREIGVRKVLGASVANISTLLSKDFIKLVFVAILIASPIAWWSMNKWLAGYEYRITISIWTFIGAGMIAMLIALCTVSYQAIKAAMMNPVKSLRSE